MRVGAIVQARMTSTRLPEKVLAPLAGQPALAWVLERLDHARTLDAVAVATSGAASDDPVAAFCAQRGTACHRGSLDDVASRMLAAARAEDLDAFVRVNGDSPLLDQALVDHGVVLMRESDADLVSNVRPRTFPPGQSVEVVRTDALERALAGEEDPEAREHVTGPLYAEGFRVLRFEAGRPTTAVALTLDTEDDHARLEAILQAMQRPHWQYGWEEVLTLA